MTTTVVKQVNRIKYNNTNDAIRLALLYIVSAIGSILFFTVLYNMYLK